MLDTIKGELRIFVKEVEGKVKGKKVKRNLYTTCIGGNKLEDDTYINAYVPVAFSKKVDIKLIKNATDVIVKDAWFTAYTDKDEIVRPKLFINKCKVIELDTDEEEE